MKHLEYYFHKHPVIAGLRDKKTFFEALKSNVIALFILYGDIMDLPEIIEKAKKYDKLVFLHIDLIKGIGRDKAGVKYLAENNLCDGIVTTKSSLIETAKNEDLMAVQRLFLLDSAALKTGVHLLKNNKPDAIEILPGIAAPYFIEHIQDELVCPIIAGGLIRYKDEVKEILEKGAMAVSSSNSVLWDY